MKNGLADTVRREVHALDKTAFVSGISTVEQKLADHFSNGGFSRGGQLR